MNIGRIFYALLIAVATVIVCLVLAAVLDLVHIKFVNEIGDILRTFAPAFGIFGGILYYLRGESPII